MEWEEYQKKCYLLSRYRDRYLSDKSFEEKTASLIAEGMNFPEGIAYMEAMMGRTGEYEKADILWAPILIYVGDPLCYGVLDSFGRLLGEALTRLGETVEYYDIGKNDISGLADFVGLRFTAVIGMQSYAFAVTLGDGTNLHDKIIGPKYNMIFDHPVWLRDHLENGPKDYYVLTHDNFYVNFVKLYFQKVKGAYLLPPGGVKPESFSVGTDREYPLSFVGSYHDWRLWKGQLREADKKTHGVARAYLNYMLHHRDITWEEGLSDVLLDRGESVYGDAFRDLLFEIKPVCFIVMSYIREKIIDAIAESGIELHVFGESWNHPRFAGFNNIIRHPEVTPAESLEIYRRSLASLNIMSWHKGGMTERLANMMLQGALVITDTSEYISEHYEAGEDYVEISLEDIDSIPGTISDIISDREKIRNMTHSAYEKASGRETWDDRAEKLRWILCERL
ncbi:MAG: glycosyltransferase family 1 protein [Lachnospiraceae bacterium]|nr:glycosyltransferase family 1 protein [Lachnospiraceae bacterium]